MAEEKSVLTEETIRQLLREQYAVSVQSARRLPIGTANCYRAETDRGPIFCKELPARFTDEGAEREAALLEHLRGCGFPTAAILRTKSGAASAYYGGHVILVQEWIEGKTYADCAPEPILMHAAALLGQMHTALLNYPLPMSMDREWLDAYSPEKSMAQYDALLEELENIPYDPLYMRIREDLFCKRSLAASVADYGRYYEGITYTPTHGDYSSLQWLCCGDKIRAVIDFSSACTIPAVWEIMRSYVQSSGACADGEDFPTDSFCAYVRQYMRYAPLTAADLKNMPYVYLFQLSRSRYGYKEYLLSDREDREALIRFAFRRTDICRAVDRAKEQISRALAELADEHVL